MENKMVEVKADALEQSFDAIEEQGVGPSLADELQLLKARVNAGLLASARPALEVGTKSAEASGYVERYLRRGVDSGLEMKAADNSSSGAGGFAVPREIDEEIQRTLVARSPIRAICRARR
jgi:HK97 family phage major capsid protein